MEEAVLGRLVTCLDENESQNVSSGEVDSERVRQASIEGILINSVGLTKGDAHSDLAYSRATFHALLPGFLAISTDQWIVTAPNARSNIVAGVEGCNGLGGVVERDRKVDGVVARVESLENLLCFLLKQIFVGQHIGELRVVGVNRRCLRG